MVVPNEEVLVANQCDFQEGLSNGNSDITVPLTNWGKEPIFINKYSQIGKIEQVDLVSKEDPHWKAEQSDTPLVVRLCQSGNDERNVQLKERLRIGDAVTYYCSQMKHSHSVRMNWARLAWWNTQLIPKIPHQCPQVYAGKS